MSDPQIPESNPNQKPFAAEPPPKISSNGGGKHSYHAHGPNPPETVIPDAATLREQWRFAVRQYSRWYSQAWGTAILAGVSFFALGWIIKGSNPLPSFQSDKHKPPPADNDNDKDKPLHQHR